ncbi:MAG: hypothetical protein IJW29_05205 [Clostridia bacterium]|nr:hypothetical protein [Clostridia bacterium]
MRRRYLGRRRAYRRGCWRIGTLVVVLALTVLLLVSCMAGSGVLWVRGLLGWDVGDYAAEPTERTLANDGEVALMLCDTVRVVLDDRVQLEEFRGTSQALKLYRDEILNYMLRSDYAAYTGNASAVRAVAKQYPTLSVATLISEKDFESTVYRYFGGSGVDHKSGDMFRYLGRAGYYTTPTSARACNVEIKVLLVEETANTYRMDFKLIRGGTQSETYRAIFVKREDSAPYWKALQIK